MKCNVCGFENNSDSLYCGNCGTKLSNDQLLETSNNNVSTNSSSHKKHKPILFLIPVVLLILIGVGLFAFFNLKKEPREYYFSLLDKMASNVVNSGNKKYDTIISDFSISFDNTIVYDEEIMNILTKLQLAMQTGIDYNNKIMYLHLDSKYSKDKLLDAHFLFEGDYLYIKSDDLYNETLVLKNEDFKDYFDFEKVNNENQITIYRKIILALKESLDDEYFSKEEETITIDEKTIDAEVLILDLPEDKLNALIKSVCSKLKDDEEFLEAYAALYETNKEDAKEQLNDIKTIECDLKLKIYTKGIQQNLVKMNIEYVIEEEKYNIDITKKDDVLNVNISNSKDVVNFDLSYKVNYNNAIEYDMIDKKNAVEPADEVLINIQENMAKLDGFNNFTTDISNYLSDIINNSYQSMNQAAIYNYISAVEMQIAMELISNPSYVVPTTINKVDSSITLSDVPDEVYFLLDENGSITYGKIIMEGVTYEYDGYYLTVIE